jgi:hypothetical protein
MWRVRRFFSDDDLVLFAFSLVGIAVIACAAVIWTALP